MNANVNLEAALGVLLLLGFGFSMLSAGLVLAYALVRRRGGWAKAALLSMLAGSVLYGCMVAVFSLRSKDKALARGDEKYFCEIDCHLAYSVLDVQRTKTLGDATAAGLFYVVEIRTRFDENTISPRRGNSPLTPNPRDLTVTDEHGHVYGVSPGGERALAAAQGAGTPLSTPLRPGESYTTKLVFDLPEDVREARLLVNESDPLTHFIIGHENSPLHAKTEFRLEPAGGWSEGLAGVTTPVK